MTDPDPLLGTPDVVGFGEQIVCPCGYFKFGPVNGSALAVQARCPHCGSILEAVPS